MTLSFLLALFSAFVRWLGLFRVRALKQKGGTRMSGEQSSVDKQQPFFNFYSGEWPFVAGGAVGIATWTEMSGQYPSVNGRPVCVDINHVPQSASARARRQDTGVPGLLREAPNKNLELMMESI
jgi:hypothetical protein